MVAALICVCVTDRDPESFGERAPLPRATACAAAAEGNAKGKAE